MSVLLTSCSFVDQMSPKSIIEQVFSAIEEEDEDALRALFAVNVVSADPEFDAKITELIEFVDGDLVSYDDWGGGGEEASFGEEGTRRYSNYSFDVETTETSYRFAIRTCTVDSEDANNLGIHSLYVIRQEDDPYPEYAYGGDGKDTPGIHFNAVFEEPAE